MRILKYNMFTPIITMQKQLYWFSDVQCIGRANIVFVYEMINRKVLEYLRGTIITCFNIHSRILRLKINLDVDFVNRTFLRSFLFCERIRMFYALPNDIGKHFY